MVACVVTAVSSQRLEMVAAHRFMRFTVRYVVTPPVTHLLPLTLCRKILHRQNIFSKNIVGKNQSIVVVSRSIDWKGDRSSSALTFSS